MSKLLRASLFTGLIIAFLSAGLYAQEVDNFIEDEFSEVELDDTDFAEDDFDDVEFDDEDFAEDEFAEDEIEEIDADELETAEDLEEVAEDELEPVQEDPGSEDLLIEEELEQPVAEDTLDLEPVDEPISDDLVPPEVAEEDVFSSPVGPDEPNLDYEAKLHDIYTRFHKDKTSEEDWQTIVGQRITELYTIQKNDKLWEISRTLFGDGNYWPKVWSLNSRIRNPHLIKPKNKIQFVLGDEDGPPAFSITEEEEYLDEADEEVLVDEDDDDFAEAEESDTNEPEIPPPLVTSRPVVKRLPPSLPKWQVLGEQGEFDELGIDYGERKITKLKNKIPLAAYVSERTPDPIGTVSEVEAGSNIASTLQYVYVEMDPGTAQIGDTLMVIRNMGPVEKAHSSITGFLGFSIEIQGEVQLVEQVPRKAAKKSRRRRRRGRRDSNKELYRAIVSKLVNPVSVGSSLIPGRVEFIEISEKGPRSQVVAQFVGGQYFNKRQVYGAESVAYLNRGSNDSLQVGQILSVRENRTIRNENTLVQSNVRPIGWVRVVKVEPNLSTVVVVRAWSDIMTGDLTGSGDFVPKKGEGPVDLPQDNRVSRSLLQELDELPASSTGEEGEDFSEGEADDGGFSDKDLEDGESMDFEDF